ncbi:O-acyltransferase like protein-like isoform X1 [Ostrinia furnacalis]|uniref:O-acyltransferase like protein-like isoform X1 n=1 Tax=Ostrinia furnacalis TaxID=93504 RepID=UPI00103B11B9|nr:O-acyltransferase like protein-like isoform X1 [Ostrinia furnacalis]
MLFIESFFAIIVLVQFVCGDSDLNQHNRAFDQSIYEDALDSVLCEEHLAYIQNDLLLTAQFIDSGLRAPRGILEGNTVDLGNYHQCLSINRQLEDSELQGKYCLIKVPLNQNIELPGLDLRKEKEWNLQDISSRMNMFEEMNLGAKGLTGIVSNHSRLSPDSPLASLELMLAVCIPKTCTTEQALASSILTEIGFQYEEELCRLPNDKPWVPGDYVALVLFSLIGFLTIVSTMYDVFGKFVKKNEFQKPNYIIFSLYTNCRRLLNFSSGPDALHCLDGIRSLAMLWVLIGHTFSTVDFWSNPLVGMEWQLSLNALWLVSATITVDTFFMLSGLLVVYTTVGKLSGIKLIKNIHLFYLNRLLRIFPVLATGVLIEASLLNHLSDGPYWVEVSNLVERCRGSWWTTLLYIQNYYSPTPMCLGVGWYLAIDMQLHILSPLVLFWVLNGKKTVARVALAVAFLLHLSASTAYNFVMEFPSTTFHPGRTDDVMLYVKNYYINTLTRATPFMVGMIVGYILACSRGKKIRLSKPIVVLGWLCTAALLLFVIYCSNPIIQPEWDNQIADSLYNSFIRGTWAAALGWLVFACVHGYGGPVNWFLSLSLWKLPARLSFAMYILHFGLMVVVNSSALAPRFFSVNSVMYTFLGHFCLVFMMSFVVVLFIDAPFSVLVKKVLSGVPKGAKKPMTEPENTRESNKQV